MERRIPDCLKPRSGDPLWSSPLDEFDLAVRLETEGVTDEVARSMHGFTSTLSMAEVYFPSLVRASAASPAAGAPSGLRAWLRGTFFAFTMLLCALSMLTIGVSLWGGALPADLASAVAIATVASLVVTGGFVQAMSRRALFYLGAANIPAAAAVARFWGVAGVGAVVTTALAGLAANLMFA